MTGDDDEKYLAEDAIARVSATLGMLAAQLGLDNDRIDRRAQEIADELADEYETKEAPAEARTS